MNRRIIFSLLMIVAIVAGTAAATWAYFSANVADKTATVTTAKIGVGEIHGFPLNYDKILPGETMALDFDLKNTGNRNADFYTQLVGGLDTDGDPNYMNFCLGSLGDDALRVTIEERGSGGALLNTPVNNAKLCNMYPGHTNSVIYKLADDVAVGQVRYFRVKVSLAALAGNEYMNKTNTDYVNLIAVQYDGPAPIPDKDNGNWGNAWPLDEDTDNDPNYP